MIVISLGLSAANGLMRHSFTAAMAGVTLADFRRLYASQVESLQFRQSPTFEDCFPSSEKCYKEVEHNGETLRVSSQITADG